MNANTNKTRNSTAKLLKVVVALQVMTVLGLWTGQRVTSNASAAVPDPGAQREAMVAEQKETNNNLDKLIELLKSGDAKVKVAQEK
jgi:hypothetical protein